MEFNQAKEILENIYIMYPNFNRKDIDNFDKIWLRKLMLGDFERTKQKLDEYLLNNQFPPTLADILVRKPVEYTIDPFEADRLAVEKEKQDPEKAKLREQKLKELRKAAGGDFID